MSATTQDQRSSPTRPRKSRYMYSVEIGRLRLTHVRLEPSKSPERWRIDHHAERRPHVRVRSLGDRRHDSRRSPSAQAARRPTTGGVRRNIPAKHTATQGETMCHSVTFTTCTRLMCVLELAMHRHNIHTPTPPKPPPPLPPDVPLSSHLSLGSAALVITLC